MGERRRGEASSYPDSRNTHQQILDMALTAQRCCRNEPQRALELSHQGLSMAESAGYTFGIARCRHMLGVIHLQRGECDDARFHLEEARELFTQLREEFWKTKTEFAIAGWHWKIRQGDRALEIYTRNLDTFKRLGESQWIIMTLYSMVDIRKKRGEMSEALELAMEGLRIAEETGDEIHMAGCLNAIGMLHYRMDDIPEALVTLEKSLVIKRRLNERMGEGIALVNIGGILVESGQPEKGLSYLEGAIEIFRETGYLQREGNAWNSMGGVYLKRGDHDEALRCYRRALRMLRSAESPEHLGALYHNLGQIYLHFGQYKSAIDYILRALESAITSCDRHLEYQVYALLSALYEKLGDTSKALESYRQYHRLREMIVGCRQQQQVLMVRSRFAERKIRDQIDEQEERMQKLEEEMEEKSRELTTLSLQLTQKNELIVKLKNRVKNIERGDAGLRDAILEQIDQGLRTDAGLGAFAGQFNRTHHDFCAYLSRLHPELTPTELKICGFIHLGLASKEIASLLHIAVRTVEIHRGRIRKRLRLPPQDSLALFLKGIPGFPGAH